MYMANRNVTTLDAGVPVLAMHAPFEDVYKRQPPMVSTTTRISPSCSISRKFSVIKC